MSLKEFLASHDYTATTEGGYQWLKKALHPAEPTIKAPRCPSGGARPTATQECTVTVTVDAPAVDPAEPSAPWRMGIFMKNDALCPIHIITANETTGAPNTTHVTGLNQCFATGTNPVGPHTTAQYAAALNTFRASCEQYRVNALSYTAVFIGATLTDQGSAISAQVSDAHQVVCSFHPNTFTADAIMQRAHLITQNLPTSETLVMGASPYIRKAKEGVYVPYKIQCPGRWFSSDDSCLVARTANHMSTLADEWSSVNHTCYPYGNVLANGQTPGLWLPPSDDNLSATWLTGLARTTSFRITYRICVEVMTRPDSLLAAFCELPALPDDHALRMYFEIASRMKDAYPSDDNDKGTLWEKVKNVAKGLWGVVSPAIAAAVPGGQLAVSAINKVVPAVSGIVSAMGDKKASEEAAAKSRALLEKAMAKPAGGVAGARVSKPKAKAKAAAVGLQLSKKQRRQMK